MALRLSTNMVNNLAQGIGLRDLINGGKLVIYSGTRPATGDASIGASTALATVTAAGGAWTAAVRATFTITLASTTSGAVTALTVGGMPLLANTVTWTSSNDNTASLLATEINTTTKNSTLGLPQWSAVAASGVVTVTAPIGSTTAWNGMTVAITETLDGTVTINGGSSTTVGGTGATAGAAAVNGLSFTFPATVGKIEKTATAWYDSSADATGTATWYRLYLDSGDTGAEDTTFVYRRIDGSVGTSASDLIMSSTSITAGTNQTISSFAFTVPSA